MLKTEEVQSVFKLHDHGLNATAISHKLNVSTTTVYRYLDNENRYKSAKNLRKEVKTSSLLKSYLDYIKKRTKEGVTNGRKLHLELIERGYKGSYGTLYRYLNQKSNSPKSNYRHLRFETKPGEQAQVDWGYVGEIIVDEKVRKLYCFVYTLGF